MVIKIKRYNIMNFADICTLANPPLRMKRQEEKRLEDIGVEAHLDIKTPAGNRVLANRLIEDHNNGEYVPKRFYTDWNKYAKDTSIKEKRSSQEFGGRFHPVTESAFVPAYGRSFFFEKGARERGLMAGTIYDHEVHGHGETFHQLKEKYGNDKAGQLLLALGKIKLNPCDLNVAEAVSKYAAYDLTQVSSKDVTPEYANSADEFIAEIKSAKRIGKQIPQEAIELSDFFMNIGE